MANGKLYYFTVHASEKHPLIKNERMDHKWEILAMDEEQAKQLALEDYDVADEFLPEYDFRIERIEKFEEFKLEPRVLDHRTSEDSPFDEF